MCTGVASLYAIFLFDAATSAENTYILAGLTIAENLAGKKNLDRLFY